MIAEDNDNGAKNIEEEKPIKILEDQDKEQAKADKAKEKATEKAKLIEEFASLNKESRLGQIDLIFFKENILLSDALRIKADVLLKMFKSGTKLNFMQAMRLSRYMHNVSASQILNEKRPLPTHIEFEQKTKKIRQLEGLMKDKYQFSLGRAISLSDKKFKGLMSGKYLCSPSISSRITRYFFCDPKYFKNDDLELPPLDKLKVDESILSIQRADFENEIIHYQNKNYIYRNYQILSHKRRVWLFTSLGLVVIPLLAYTGYCATVILQDTAKVYSEYSQGAKYMSAEQEIIQDTIESNTTDEMSPVNVGMGTEIVKISNISPSTSSYNLTLRVWMDFDVETFHQAYCKYRNKENVSVKPQAVYSGGKFTGEYTLTTSDGNDTLHNLTYSNIRERYVYDEATASFYLGEDDHIAGTTGGNSPTRRATGDGVPDYLQIKNYYDVVASAAKPEVNPAWLEEKAFYPGNTSSNNYPDRETMFVIANGDFVADSFSYESDIDYVLTQDIAETDKITEVVTNMATYEYRHFTKFYCEVTIRKPFKSPRYPLESLELDVYLQAMQLNTDYIRYTKVSSVDMTKAQAEKNALTNRLDTGAAVRTWSYYLDVDDAYYETCLSSRFSLAGGYHLLSTSESAKYQGFVQRIHYHQDNDSQNSYRTEYEIVLRANRSGVSTFLKAFINIFSVIIWIIIAFYSQSYQGENQLGMMGTGLFAAISSILVGLSMVSDAGIFSLITMINIFTLAVILIMTYQCITARSANVKQDRVMIAYNGIKLRVLFILLTVCTGIMFIGLPLFSFIFIF